MRLATIEAAIDAATRAWTGWDFPRTVRPCSCGEADSPHVETIGPGSTDDWEHWRDCRTEALMERWHSAFCASEIAWAEAEFGLGCQMDADAAAELGHEAMELLRHGDIGGAWERLRMAANLERQYHGEDWEAVAELLCRTYPFPLAKGEKP